MTSRGRPLRVLVIDDHELFAEALRKALESESPMVHRLLPTDIAKMMAAAPADVRRTGSDYDLALLDVDLDGFGDGSKLISPLAEAGTVVVVLTGSADPARWGESVHLGAAKVISKSASLDEVIAIVRGVRDGAPLATRSEHERLLRAWYERKLREEQLCPPLEKLSPAERDLLRQLTLGRTFSEIAAAQDLSPASVRTQLNAILSKLEVSSQIAAAGLRNGAVRRRT
jgi:two-component system, NarL family, nitrate/nitrite response regulator NarL